MFEPAKWEKNWKRYCYAVELDFEPKLFQFCILVYN